MRAFSFHFLSMVFILLTLFNALLMTEFLWTTFVNNKSSISAGAVLFYYTLFLLPITFIWPLIMIACVEKKAIPRFYLNFKKVYWGFVLFSFFL